MLVVSKGGLVVGAEGAGSWLTLNEGESLPEESADKVFSTSFESPGRSVAVSGLEPRLGTLVIMLGALVPTPSPITEPCEALGDEATTDVSLGSCTDGVGACDG